MQTALQLKPGQIAYRQKKNKQFWVTLSKYGEFLHSQGAIPIEGAGILTQKFRGRQLMDLSPAETTRFWRECAEAQVRKMVKEQFGTEHISELNGSQLLHMAEYLEVLMHGGIVTHERNQFPRSDDTITPDQLDAIAKMYAAMQWEPYRQEGYNRRIIKKDAPETKGDASKLIRAIQSMFLHDLDLDAFRKQVAFCQANSKFLDSYKRGLVADAARKVSSGKKQLTMGLVCKVYECIEHIQTHRQRELARGKV